MKRKTRKCPECELEFNGRTDKKFCSYHCKNSFHNSLKRDSNNYTRNINCILRNNRRILIGFYRKDKPKINKYKLLIRGFNFDYYTTTSQTKSGKIYYYCYEYGYQPMANDHLTIVKKKDYLDY